MDSKTLECENDRSQAGSLYLGHCVFRHNLPEFLVVDSETLPWWGSSSSAGSLLSLTPAQWHHQNISTQQKFWCTKHSSRSQSACLRSAHVHVSSLLTLILAPHPGRPGQPASCDSTVSRIHYRQCIFKKNIHKSKVHVGSFRYFKEQD